ncbi:3'-5' exonuclease [Tamlana sp. 2201CG12-4]|uniref:3'-5' exonuclease n=1 Tax=Tamlana sp. 2201CG12-4 TaxID=3112582 RepID=UPI002DBCF3F3|nr:3'-5' exonuclease [Tamlana sp. 2201CG12-4]MEC3908555.1 3'-5' exonuclease [Tamlana sp. 2201CG12-4]
MVLKWFKKGNKNYPDFWMDYLEHFKKFEKTPIKETRFIAFDTETTGFDRKKDRVLSIGAVAFTGKSIPVNGSLELYLEQDIFNPDTVEIHELMKSSKVNKVSEIEALKTFLAYIKNSVLIAHHANFDRNMMNEMLSRHGLGMLKNKFIDTGILFNKSKHIIYRENLKEHYTLDDLSKALNVPMIDRHTASGDALITAIVFLKILSRLEKRKNLEWGYLLNR